MELVRNENLNYKVTTDPDYFRDQYHVTPEIERILTDLQTGVEKGKKHLVRKLTKYCLKYPKVPTFKNMLVILHVVNNNMAKAEKTHKWLLKENPDYIFGKSNLANGYLENEDYDKIPEILGSNLEIHSLYPNRTEFHSEEILSFYQIAVEYLVTMDKWEEAEARMNIMEELDANHEKTLLTNKVFLEGQNEMLQAEIMEKEAESRNRREELKNNLIGEKRAKVQTSVPPVFNFPVHIQELYEIAIYFDSEKIEDILSLERESLIEDLCAVLNDSIVRFDFFMEKEAEDGYSHEKFSFVIHAMLLLAELKASEAIEQILEVFKQDEDYNNLWFSDYLFTAGPAAIFSCGKNRMDKLKDFLKLPLLTDNSKTCVSTAIAKIPFYFPERRSEIVDLYRKLLRFYIEKVELIEVEYYDRDNLSMLVLDLTDAGFHELFPEIKQLFELEIVDDWICYDLETIGKIIVSAEFPPEELEPYNTNIFEKYENLQSMREDTIDEDDAFAIENEYFYDDDDEQNDFADNSFWKENEPVTKPKKIGRNDSCPCGSGKKYKKCCLNAG